MALLNQEPRDPDAPEPLDDEQLRAIISSEIEQSVNHSTSEIAIDQEKALRFYEGQPFGNEIPGSSGVVLRDVAETIDWAMPAIMRAFFYTNKTVRYEDTTPDSEKRGFGRIMTLAINEIFRGPLRGVRLSHDWAKAGLLEKFATVKFWIDLVREPSIERSTVSDLQLVQLHEDPDVELFEATTRTVASVDPASGLPVQTEVHDVRYKRWRQYHRMRLETVPPEEFLCSSRARRLDQDIDFIAHRRKVTRSELASLGVPWELVGKLSPTSTTITDDSRAIAREENPDFGARGSLRRDKASQTVTLTESYIRVDYDGDGYSELRKVLTGGDIADTMLGHDYAEMHGFAGWTPIPMPHQLYGRGYYDVVSDLQLIRSTLLRQLLDNIYRMNNARHKVIEGEVDMDSYMDTAPGAPVGVERMESMEALEVPALPSWSFDALSYLEKVREQRTGIHPYSQESYAAGQNQTATGASQIFEAAMAQIQLICQMFGEGLTDLFRIIPRMMKAAGMGPDRIKVGDEWIDYNPQEWPDDMRVTVEVGLSPGQTEQRIQRLLLLLSLQKEALATLGEGTMVTLDQLYGTAVRLVEQSGFQNPNAFFSDPTGKQMPPQPPSPEQMKLEVDAKNLQAQRALDLSKLEHDRAHKQEQEQRLAAEAMQKYAVERERLAMEERVRRYEADQRYAAALTQSQATLVDGGSPAAEGGGGAAVPGQASAVLVDITERLDEVDPT